MNGLVSSSVPMVPGTVIGLSVSRALRMCLLSGSTDSANCDRVRYRNPHECSKIYFEIRLRVLVAAVNFGIDWQFRELRHQRAVHILRGALKEPTAAACTSCQSIIMIHNALIYPRTACRQ